MTEELKKRVAQINAGTAPAGYKKTKVGIVPEKWEIVQLGALCNITTGKLDANAMVQNGQYKFFTCSHDEYQIDTYAFDGEAILIAGNGDVGYTRYYSGKFNAYQRTYVLMYFKGIIPYLKTSIDLLLPRKIQAELSGSAMPYITLNTLTSLRLPFPAIEEQKSIAEILTAQDEVISLIEKQIELLKTQKKGFLQKMFPAKGCKVPEIRFKEFTGNWEHTKLGTISECLDSMRVPLNSEERSKIQGDIPYYGAVSIQDYINKYLFDEELVLLLEDGDAFDDFRTKSIAQYICGKSWVNNHAHILRPKGDAFFLYISLVHKDIRNVIQLAGASRKKLVKDAMLRIEVDVPSIEEQKKIGRFFKEFDALIALHQRKLEIEQQKKKALMQLLLTGKVRVKT